MQECKPMKRTLEQIILRVLLAAVIGGVLGGIISLFAFKPWENEFSVNLALSWGIPMGVASGLGMSIVFAWSLRRIPLVRAIVILSSYTLAFPIFALMFPGDPDPAYAWILASLGCICGVVHLKLLETDE